VDVKTQNHKKTNTIAIFGEVLADVFPDKTILGGAPFNVARHLKGFTLNPVFITRTGNDALREVFLEQMHARNMDTIGVQQDPTHPTGQVKVTLTNGQPSYDILQNQAYDHIHAGLAHMVTMSLNPQVAYFGTLAQRTVPSRLALDQFLSDAHCPRFLDINLREPWYDHHTLRRSLLRTDVLKLNEDELAILAKEFKLKAQNLSAQSAELLGLYHLKEIIVTAGEKGAWCINNKGETFTSDAPNTQITIKDTVGAGDGFASVCILGLLKQWDKKLTLNRANQFAGDICQIQGAVPDSLEFYSAYQQEWKL
jgi:fructokinase